MHKFLFLPAVLLSIPAYAQERFYTSSTRGGADGARQQLQLQQVQNATNGAEACANLGMIYAPGHPQRDASNCIVPFRIQADGRTNFTVPISVPFGSESTVAVSLGSPNHGLYARTAAEINISTGGTERLRVEAAGINVFGDVRTSGTIFVGSVSISNIPQCASNQKLQWTSSVGWSCVSDL